MKSAEKKTERKGGKRKRQRIRNLLILLALLLAAGTAGYWFYQRAGVIEVETRTVVRGSIREITEETGTVAAGQISVVAAKTGFNIRGVSCSVGDMVQAGAVLVTTDLHSGDADVRSLQEQAESIRVLYRQAVRNREQLEVLYENGAVSLKDLETAQANEAELAARARSAEYSASSLQSSKEDTRVVAPVTGLVTELFVSEGDTAAMGSPLVEITDMNSLYIRADLLSQDAEKVSAGDRVLFPDHPGAEGVVRESSPKVREQISELGIVQKRQEMEVTASGLTMPALGSDIRLQIITAEKNDVLLVPKTAVFSYGEQDCVYVVSEERAVLKQVRIGLKGTDDWEVTEGLEEGVVVILSPDSSLQDGSRLRTAV